MAGNENLKSDFNRYIKKVEDEIEVVVRRVLLKLKADAIKILRDEKKVGYSHQLISNIRDEVTRLAGRILGVVGVGSNVPYGVFVHDGTKPHFVPIEPLVKWVIFKGLAKRSRVNARLKSMKSATLKRNSTEEVRAKGIAIAISKVIGKKGTKGIPFLKKALEMNMGFIEEQISKLNIV